MAIAEVIMPKMGDGMEEGKLLSWKKRDGEQVHAGEAIAEIETDKAAVTIEAEEAGTLRTRIAEGESVPVGAVIATIGEGAAEPAAASPAKHTAAAPATPKAKPAPAGPNPAPPQWARNGESHRLKASPLARRIARERGVALESLRGTGPHGRIVGADVSAATSAHAAVVASAPAPGAPDEVREMSAMRRTIARRMTESKTPIPHFYVTSEIDMDAAVELRRQLNGYDDSLAKISLNDFVVKASALALMKAPEVNRSFQGGGYASPTAAHVGIAVALDDGLIVPVVRDANTKSLRSVARESRELIEKARSRKLQPAEYSGGTFTVSNLGTFDVENFIAIIDPSQGAILAVGSIRKKPVVMQDDSIAVRQRMNVTLSGDHRVMDGASGARFLQELKRLLQSPLSLLE